MIDPPGPLFIVWRMPPAHPLKRGLATASAFSAFPITSGIT
jgi:hypothetical protein